MKCSEFEADKDPDHDNRFKACLNCSASERDIDRTDPKDDEDPDREDGSVACANHAKPEGDIGRVRPEDDGDSGVEDVEDHPRSIL